MVGRRLLAPDGLEQLVAPDPPSAVEYEVGEEGCPFAPGSASSTRLPASLTTSRPQSWIRVSAVRAIGWSLVLRQGRRKVRERDDGHDRQGPNTRVVEFVTSAFAPHRLVEGTLTTAIVVPCPSENAGDPNEPRSGCERHQPASFYGSPHEALQAPPEEFLYLACLHQGTGVDKPDFLAVVDAEQGRIVHETPMPNVGDELHHFGWNRCSSACHGPDRSHLIVPGFRSSRIHILNVADDPRAPRIEKVIERDELVAKTGYTRPHTVHCMPGDNVVVSMLGDADGNGAGGFAVLDAKTFEVKGRWENGGETPPFNYDFWYQPRKNVLVSSEFGEPNAYEPGFDPADVEAGRYGHRLHFWNLAERTLEQTVDLGETGLLPFEVRWKHDPEAEEGFVGAALSTTMWRFRRDNGGWAADQVIAVEPRRARGLALPGARRD